MSSLPSDDARRTAPATRSRDTAWAATAMLPRSQREPARINALLVATHLAEFEPLRVLGEGGFGIVYRARDHSLQRRMAIQDDMPAMLANRAGLLALVVTSERRTARCSRPAWPASSMKPACWPSSTTAGC